VPRSGWKIFGLVLGILERSGAYFFYGPDRLGQGKDNTKKTLEENPALLAEIEEKIRNANLGQILDEEPVLSELDDEEEFDISSLGLDDDE
jgi:recombination protein RecA